MGWRVVDCLIVLELQLKAMFPKAAPPNTSVSAWGTIADAAHDPTSDHAIHSYPGLLDVVCAHDFPHAPDKGMDGGDITEQLRLSHDPRIGYAIFNGRIFSGHVVDGVPAYTWRKYNGSDQHKKHFHVSSVHTILADDKSQWNLEGGNAMADLTLTASEQAEMLLCIRQTQARVNALFTDENSKTPNGSYRVNPVPSNLVTETNDLSALLHSVQNLIDGIPARTCELCGGTSTTAIDADAIASKIDALIAARYAQ